MSGTLFIWILFFGGIVAAVWLPVRRFVRWQVRADEPAPDVYEAEIVAFDERRRAHDPERAARMVR